MPKIQPQGKESLGTLSQKITAKFNSLAVSARLRDDNHLQYDAFVNEARRFGLWARDMGLSSGHRLSYETTQELPVHSFIQQLVQDLESSMQTIEDWLCHPKLHTSPHREEPLRLIPDRSQVVLNEDEPNHEGRSGDSSEDEEADSKSYDDASVIDIALVNIQRTITNLYQISFEIAYPVTGFGLPKAQPYDLTSADFGVTTQGAGEEERSQPDVDKESGTKQVNDRKESDITANQNAAKEFKQQELDEVANLKQSGAKSITNQSSPTKSVKSARSLAGLPYSFSNKSEGKSNQTPTAGDAPQLKQPQDKEPAHDHLYGPIMMTSSPSEHCRLSFIVKIEPLRLNDSIPGKLPRKPRKLPTSEGPALTMCWEGGRLGQFPADDLIRRVNLRCYRRVTVFQDGVTQEFFTVPFDARTEAVKQWRTLSFYHQQSPGRQRYMSYITCCGTEPVIAAPGSAHWMPQLLPWCYQHRPTAKEPRVQAGLIGDLSLLMALAAFSSPPTALDVMLDSVQPGTWKPHYPYAAGRDDERGMVVTVSLDPRNPEFSNRETLDRLQNGSYGPFYGP